MLKKALLLTALPLSLLFAEALPSTLDFSTLITEFIQKEHTLKRQINLSGKQRMLTPRMVKLSESVLEY